MPPKLKKKHEISVWREKMRIQNLGIEMLLQLSFRESSSVNCIVA